MAHLVGVDVGTTTIKAVLLDPERGEVADHVGHTNEVHHPHPEWSEFHPEKMWETVASCVRRLTERNRPVDVRAISVSSMGEAGVPIDAHGRCLYPIIAWYDPRTEHLSGLWEQRFGAWELFQITGLAIRHVFSINKILWLRANRPEVVREMRKWLCIEDFIIWKMSGEYATDYTIASRTMAFDQRKKSWSREILEFVQLDAGILPEIHPSGEMVGQLTPSAARQMGLRSGTPVVTGGHDHLCAALAAGLLRADQVLDSSGTAQAVLALTAQFKPGRELFDASFTHYAHVVKDQYIVQGGLPAAGGAIEWFARLLGGGDRDGASADDYDVLFSEAAAIPPGSRGVFCVPYLLGSGTPHYDPCSRGALLGFNLSHSRGHAFRSVIEALGYSLRENVEAIQTALGQSISEIVAVGGANREPLARQIKADISGRKIVAPQLREATATGAALLAGVGGGIFDDARQACCSLNPYPMVHLPDPDARVTYDRHYHDVYLKLHRALEDVTSILSSL